MPVTGKYKKENRPVSDQFHTIVGIIWNKTFPSNVKLTQSTPYTLSESGVCFIGVFPFSDWIACGILVNWQFLYLTPYSHDFTFNMITIQPKRW